MVWSCRSAKRSDDRSESGECGLVGGVGQKKGRWSIPLIYGVFAKAKRALTANVLTIGFLTGLFHLS